MLFWILLGVAVIAVIITAIVWYNDWYGGFANGLMGAFIASLISFGLLGVYSLTISITPTNYHLNTESNTYALQAMGSGTATEGRVTGSIFLTSGYIDERQVLSYVRETPEGGYVLRRANADDSTVFQGPDSPRLELDTHTFGNPWLYPWTFESQNFRFYVPEGSVASTYNLAPTE